MSKIINADEFELDLLYELKHDVNMYNSHTEKEVRDEKYEFALDELRCREPLNLWHKVEDELPPLVTEYLRDKKSWEDKEVIIQTKTGDMFFAICILTAWKYNGKEFTEMNWYTHGSGGRRMKIMSKVVAWMDKPEKFDE